MWTKVLILIFILISQIGLSQEAYSFFIAGHVYGAPGIDNPGFHPPFKAKFEYIQNREEIEFGILLGDITRWGSGPQWDNIDADILNLGLPVYLVVGNHDMYQRELFEARYGITYYSFSYNNDLFIVLDPNINQWNISGEQLTFLGNTLTQQADNHDNIFVMMHQLLWWDTNNEYGDIVPNSEEDRDPNLNFWTEVEPLFHNLSNTVVMCAGDLGAASYASDFMYDNYDNISFVATGMGKGDSDNFIVINVDEDKNIDYDLICLNNEELFCFGELTDWEISDIHQNYYRNNVEVFPNPANETLSFKSSNRDIVSIEIFSNIGSMVLMQPDILKIEHQLNISHLASGIYAVKITTGDTFQIKKFIKL